MRRQTPLRSTSAASWILVLLMALGVPSTVAAQATDDPQHLEYVGGARQL